MPDEGLNLVCDGDGLYSFDISASKFLSVSAFRGKNTA